MLKGLKNCIDNLPVGRRWLELDPLDLLPSCLHRQVREVQVDRDVRGDQALHLDQGHQQVRQVQQVRLGREVQGVLQFDVERDLQVSHQEDMLKQN